MLRSQEPVSRIAASKPQAETTAEVPATAKSPPTPVAVTTRPQIILPQTTSEPVSQPQPEQHASEQRVYAISELPTAVQRRIPPLHMSLHAYNKANPAAGMVRVNEQILRPGATLDGKYLLAEISAEGAVFSFEGYRFLLPRD